MHFPVDGAAVPLLSHRSASLTENCLQRQIGTTTLPTIQSSRSSTIQNTLSNDPWRAKISRTHERLDANGASVASCTSSWIQQVFQKRECIKFIHDASSDRCGCGQVPSAHSRLALSRFTTVLSELARPEPVAFALSTPALTTKGSSSGTKWTIHEHTQASPTDAFGTIEFQGGPHPHKAHFVRLAFDSEPADVVQLMEKVWHLPKPKLVITIHGGVSNFQVPAKFGRRFREGLLKAAQTTGAWIITSGIDSGVVQHVAQALDEAGISARMRSQILLIGIAPWGLVRRRERLIGMDTHVAYEHPSYGHHRNRHHPALNDRHSYFLLVDNGTIGRYGADIVLRKRFEDYIAQKVSLEHGPARIPVICVTLEGGLCTVTSVLQYLRASPAIPVIVCEGSGRASDFIAYAERHIDFRGNLPEHCRRHLHAQVIKKLNYNHSSADEIVEQIVECARHRGLLTVIRSVDEDQADVDQVILRALLRGQNFSLVEQLSLTLAWNRVDIARTEVFANAHDVQSQQLYPVMMNALLLGRVDFFKLLIEQGVSVKKFLTISRLEQLYNAEPASLSTLYHLLGNNLDRAEEEEHFTLPEIGLAIERLMGNAYRCLYTTRSFKSKYEKFQRKSQLSRIGSSFHLRLSKDHRRKEKERSQSSASEAAVEDFLFPFNDLLLWAVLTRRHAMAKCFWSHGEEAMAKALVAIRLYKCMSKEAADDYTEVEVSNQLREYAEDFRECSFELLNHCYQQDEVMTMQLLTAELPNWGNHTVLSLAVIANNKRLLTHPCCQVLLAELWLGRMRFRSQSNIKVILGVLFPPTILLLNFKKPSYEGKGRRPLASAHDDSDDDELDPGSSAFNLTLTSLFKPKRRRSLKPRDECVGVEEAVPMGEKHVRILSTSNAPGAPLDHPLRRPFSSVSSRFSTMTWRHHLHQSLSKFSMFYRAPITSFWIWALSFMVFMFLLIYVLLLEFRNEVTNVEWFLFMYVLGVGLEHFRKLIATESSSFIEKLHVFYGRYWNILTTFAVLTYFLGFAFRYNIATVHTYGRTILASNSVLWHMKFYDYLSIHPKIGPYITMAGKMIMAMSYIIVMLLVVLMAFGVARQSLTFPHEKWSWLLIRNIFYKPYFMLYGEVYAGEIDTCGDEGTNCVPGGWIPPVLMTIFLLVANILLMNLLIAIFNNIFNVTNAMSQQVWMFQRYDQVLEYQSTPIVPPPFTPLVHLYKALCYVLERRTSHTIHQSKTSNLDIAIKVYLDGSELKLLHDFEEDCMDDLARRRPLPQPTSGPEQMNHANLHARCSASTLTTLVEDNAALRSELEKLESQFAAIETTQNQMLQILQTLSSKANDSGNSYGKKDGGRKMSACTGKHCLDRSDDAWLTRLKQVRKEPLRKHKSVSLSEDIEQMQLVSCPTAPVVPFATTTTTTKLVRRLSDSSTASAGSTSTQSALP